MTTPPLAIAAPVEVRRTMDAAFLNEVANHPDVRPWITEDGDLTPRLDLQGLLDNVENVALVTAHGGFVGHAQGHGVYEVHSLFLREGRGPEAVEAMHRAMDFMFTQTDCVDLVTKVPSHNQAAATLARLAGFTKRFTRAQAWRTAEGLVDVQCMGLTIQQWMLRSPEAIAHGRVWHDALTAVKDATGSSLARHEEDPVHDHVVGATWLIAQAGNTYKAVDTYNAWAQLAGYQTMRVLSVHPPIFDVRDAIVAARVNGTLEVLQCR